MGLRVQSHRVILVRNRNGEPNQSQICQLHANVGDALFAGNGERIPISCAMGVRTRYLERKRASE